MITIITVCYNAIVDLEQTILNVKAQKKKQKLIYIIIDGSSTDGTIGLVSKYEDIVDKFVSEKDDGIYDAMNKGWAIATNNSYILFLGAGDLLIELPTIDQIGNAEVVFGNVLLGGNFLFKSKMGVRLRMGNTLHHQALLIKKSTHPLPPFTNCYKTYADFDFNQRLLKNKHLFKKINGFVSYAKDGGMSSAFNTKESLAIVSKNFGPVWKILAGIYYKIQGKQ